MYKNIHAPRRCMWLFLSIEHCSTKMRKFTPSASVTYHLNQLKLALGDGGGLFDMVHSLRLGQWVWVKICVTRTGLHYTDRMIVTKDIMVEYAIRIGIWLGSLLAIFIYRTCEGLQSLI